MSYVQYAWTASKINPEDIKTMYLNRKKTKKFITTQVKEAVSLYCKKLSQKGG